MPPPKFQILKDNPDDPVVLEPIEKSTQFNATQWDDHKENIQPISRGRKINELMKSLEIIDHKEARKKLLDERKQQFENDLKESGDDLDVKLDIWHSYIDWLEQNVPDGGKVNNITNAIEECIENYYDKKKFKQDKRLFNIFMKFKNFCDEPIEIFGFMYANSICSLLAKFYLNWSWQYEMRKNMKRAEDLIKLGLKNLASPREILVEAELQIKVRIDRMIRSGELNDCPDLTVVSSKDSQRQLAEGGIRAALQTLKFKTSKKKNSNAEAGVNGTSNGACIVPINRTGGAVDTINVGGLKSQTTLVNGVPMAKGKRPTSKKGASESTSNRVVKIYSDREKNIPESNNENDVGDENAPNASGSSRLPSTIMNKIPTSQRIHTVGRTGFENQIKSSGVVQRMAHF